METYYDPQLWLVPAPSSQPPRERQIRKANPEIGKRVFKTNLKENDGLYGSGQVVPMKLKPRHNHTDTDLEADALARKIRMIKRQNSNIKLFNSFSESSGKKKPAYYRSLTEKGLGEKHYRPVPGHPTVTLIQDKIELSEDELALQRLMAKSSGHGVISCFLPTNPHRPTKEGRTNSDSWMDVRVRRRTLTPHYQSGKTHFILGGHANSKPTTAFSNSTY